MSRDASPRTEVTEQQNPQAFAEVLEALVHYYEVVKQPEEERLASPSISDHVYAKAHYFVENDVSFNGYSLIFFQLVLDLNEIYLATKKHKTLLEDLLMLQADVDSKAQTLADFESKIATLEYEKEQVNFGYNNALAPVEPLEAEVSQLSAEKLEKEKAVAQVRLVVSDKQKQLGEVSEKLRSVTEEVDELSKQLDCYKSLRALLDSLSEQSVTGYVKQRDERLAAPQAEPQQKYVVSEEDEALRPIEPAQLIVLKSSKRKKKRIVVIESDKESEINANNLAEKEKALEILQAKKRELSVEKETLVNNIHTQTTITISCLQDEVNSLGEQITKKTQEIEMLRAKLNQATLDSEVKLIDFNAQINAAEEAKRLLEEDLESASAAVDAKEGGCQTAGRKVFLLKGDFYENALNHQNVAACESTDDKEFNQQLTILKERVANLAALKTTYDKEQDNYVESKKQRIGVINSNANDAFQVYNNQIAQLNQYHQLGWKDDFQYALDVRSARVQLAKKLEPLLNAKNSDNKDLCVHRKSLGELKGAYKALAIILSLLGIGLLYTAPRFFKSHFGRAESQKKLDAAEEVRQRIIPKAA